MNFISDIVSLYCKCEFQVWTTALVISGQEESCRGQRKVTEIQQPGKKCKANCKVKWPGYATLQYEENNSVQCNTFKLEIIYDTTNYGSLRIKQF